LLVFSKAQFMKSETLVVMGGQFIQLVLTFATSMMIARILSAEGYGIINLLKTLFVTIASIAPLGLDLALLKYCGHKNADDPEFQLTLSRLRQFTLVFSIGLICLCAGAIFFTPFGAVYTYKDFDYLFLISLIALPFSVDIAILGAIYKSRGQAAQFSFMTQYLQSFVRLILVTLAILFSSTVKTIIWVSTVQLFISGVVLLWHYRFKAIRVKLPEISIRFQPWLEVKSILLVSIWMCASLFAYGLMRSADLMFLGAFSDAQNLGEYSAIATVAQLILFYPIAASQSLGPDISKKFHAGDLPALRQKLLNYTYIASIVTSFVFGGIAIFSQRLDLVLGSSFHFQPMVCLLIALGQFVSGTLAPTGYALSMTGHHKQENILIITGCLLVVALSFWIVPKYGQLGAAGASLIVVICLNLSRFYLIWRIFKFIPLKFVSLIPPVLALALAWLFLTCDQFIAQRTLLVTFFSCVLYTIAYAACAYAFFANKDMKSKINLIIKKALY
jgi:O-antigen/teichoic acid export membrane protein